MPRYDYKCSSCEHVFELRQSFNSDTVMPCPECGSTSNRQFHAPPIIFKGSGWYVNDYGKGRGNNSAGDKKESESESGSETKTEKSETPSKSESSSDSKPGSTPKTASKSD